MGSILCPQSFSLVPVLSWYITRAEPECGVGCRAGTSMRMFVIGHASARSLIVDITP